jgi:hypothetical protein
MISNNMSSAFQYHKIQAQDRTSDLDEQCESTSFLKREETEEDVDTTKGRRRLSCLALIGSAVILGAIFSSLITLMIVKMQNVCPSNSDNDLWCESIPHPVHQNISPSTNPPDTTAPAQQQVEYFNLNINNEFGAESPYRGPPTPELDAAWEELWHFGVISIPRDKLASLNRQEHLPDGRTLAKVNGSTDHFQAYLEVFHQLHCLVSIFSHTSLLRLTQLLQGFYPSTQLGRLLHASS